MPLLPIFASAPDSVYKFSIEQIVATAGDGFLKDGSVCSVELREYLEKITTEKIASYIDHCLNISFSRNGLVLQDLVNELGRRLDYAVSNGRYQGVQGGIGFDGLWLSPEQHTLIIEVKTTDAYRLSLDTLASYRNRLSEAGRLATNSSILIVVGRQDTGELEAQIRGSRHAWDIRVISAEALIKLVLLKENAGATETGGKMRNLLTPIEYTRLDRMVDVMFTAATDTEGQSEVESSMPDVLDDGEIAENVQTVAVAQMAVATKGTWQFTDGQILQSKRQKIIEALGRRESANLVKRSRALYWTAGRNVRVACAMSKRYGGKNRVPYWYAYHPQWDLFLSEVERSFFVLGCMDLGVAFAIPQKVIHNIIPRLNTTKRDSGMYWHIHLIEEGCGLAISVPKEENINLQPYQISIVNS